MKDGERPQNIREKKKEKLDPNSEKEISSESLAKLRVLQCGIYVLYSLRPPQALLSIKTCSNVFSCDRVPCPMTEHHP